MFIWHWMLCFACVCVCVFLCAVQGLILFLLKNIKKRRATWISFGFAATTTAIVATTAAKMCATFCCLCAPPFIFVIVNIGELISNESCSYCKWPCQCQWNIPNMFQQCLFIFWRNFTSLHLPNANAYAHCVLHTVCDLFVCILFISHTKRYSPA